MKPILLIHGYSSEGKDRTAADIYKDFPTELRKWFDKGVVKELDLSRWISLNDGIALDDVSFAMDRALTSEYPELLTSGFHVIIHSTGALVVRNWIRLFSEKPCPIDNLIHLAGANFGSGLAHVGQGQLARWGKHLTTGTGCGYRILNELEFGSGKTLDLHLHFLQDGQRMYEDYQVQEFCIIGSQIPKKLRLVPIRYVREDSSDCTVRTSAGNLNFNYLQVKPTQKSYEISCKELGKQVGKRLDGRAVSLDFYEIVERSFPGDKGRREIPFCIPYEIAHLGDDIGILTGEKNRSDIEVLVKGALETPHDNDAYLATAKLFKQGQKKTFDRAIKLKHHLWNLKDQYEGHAQLIFRIRDQQGIPVEHFDIFFNSSVSGENKDKLPLEKMIEHRHINSVDKGTIVFYLRTQKYDSNCLPDNPWVELLDNVAPLKLEITGEEPKSDDISYVPLTVKLDADAIRSMLQTFRTTVVDVTLARLPSSKVFAITHAQTN